MTFKITESEKMLIERWRITSAYDIEDSLEYLYSWYEMSFNIPKKFKTLKFVNSKLSPLKTIVPYKPNKIRTLYRIIGTDQELKNEYEVKLKPKQLYSCTILKGVKLWSALAEQTGAFDYDNTYVIAIDPIKIEYLFDTEWVIKVLLAVKTRVSSSVFNRLREEALSYRWQKEFVVFSNSSVKAKIEKKLFNEY